MLKYVFEEIANQLESGEYEKTQSSTSETDIHKTKIKKEEE